MPRVDKGVTQMKSVEKKILEAFSKTIPQLTDLDKERLLAFGEGIAFKANQLREAEPTTQATSQDSA